MLFKPSLLALVACRVLGAVAQDEPVAEASPAAPVPTLAADVKATFPDADFLGVRLVNGHPTKALIEVTNREDAPIQVAFISGALSTTKELPADALPHQYILRNLSTVQYHLAVEAGETKSVPFSFSLDMQPQDVRLQLVAVLSDEKKNIYQVPAYDSAATVVEPPTSFFDPQMYVILSFCHFATELAHHPLSTPGSWGLCLHSLHDLVTDVLNFFAASSCTSS